MLKVNESDLQLFRDQLRAVDDYRRHARLLAEVRRNGRCDQQVPIIEVIVPLGSDRAQTDPMVVAGHLDEDGVPVLSHQAKVARRPYFLPMCLYFNLLCLGVVQYVGASEDMRQWDDLFALGGRERKLFLKPIPLALGYSHLFALFRVVR